MSIFIRYLHLYRAYFSITQRRFQENISTTFAYVISAIIWTLVIIGIPILMANKVTRFFDYTTHDLYVYAAVQICILGLFNTFFTRNFQTFIEDVHRGAFDFSLLLPADSQFLATCVKRIHLPQLTRFTLGILILGYFGYQGYLGQITLTRVLMTVVASIGSISIMYSFWLLCSSLIFAIPRLNNIVELILYLEGFTRYPREMYLEIVPLLTFLIIPYSLVATVPTRILLGKPLGGDLWLFCGVVIGLLVLSRWWWCHSIKSYTSAGG